ncbi:hypothetical protein CVT24_010220 [Panaeolus cyanescens]|uniref:Uncharacterized protein n=1 Tax=Panaeolus cyanescens TaxID=181874 RepID=A0A409YPU5_9AGAR|nr:hypothetical protein CVT24_010220 [Panaeolus cyanescens]
MCQHFSWMEPQETQPLPSSRRSDVETSSQASFPAAHLIAFPFHSQPPLPAPSAPDFATFPSQRGRKLASDALVKERCVAGGSCYARQTKACSKRMCRRCCMKFPGVCKYSNHNADGAPPMTTSSNPAHRPRPIPVIPLRFPTADTAAGSSLAANTYPQSSPLVEDAPNNPFLFKKPVSAALLEDNRLRHAKRSAVSEQTASKLANQRRLTHAVSVKLFLNDEEEPSIIPLQDIQTWPTLNLSEFPGIAYLFGVSNLDNLQVYSKKHKAWTPTLNFALGELKTDQVIMVRLKGNRTSELSNDTPAPSPLPYYPSPLPSPSKTPSKRRAESPPPLTPPHAKISRLASVSESDVIVIPDDCSDDLLRAPDVDIISPVPKGLVWPRGLYVQDMARGFALIKLLGRPDGGRHSTERLEDRFRSVFPNAVWNSSTYHLNRKFWESLPLDEQKAAAKLPLGKEDSLWTNWRRTHPSWKYLIVLLAFGLANPTCI